MGCCGTWASQRRSSPEQRPSWARQGSAHPWGPQPGAWVGEAGAPGLLQGLRGRTWLKGVMVVACWSQTAAGWLLVCGPGCWVPAPGLSQPLPSACHPHCHLFPFIPVEFGPLPPLNMSASFFLLCNGGPAQSCGWQSLAPSWSHLPSSCKPSPSSASASPLCSQLIFLSSFPRALASSMPLFCAFPSCSFLSAPPLPSPPLFSLGDLGWGRGLGVGNRI